MIGFERLFGIGSDRALDVDWIANTLGETNTLMNRVDTRTYKENPYVVSARIGTGKLLVTTLRPQGGLGSQPFGVTHNPSGSEFLKRALMSDGKW